MKEDELSVSNASNTRQLCLKLNLHHKSKCNEKELQNKKRFCREPYAHIPRHGKQVRIGKFSNSALFPNFLHSSSRTRSNSNNCSQAGGHQGLTKTANFSIKASTETPDFATKNSCSCTVVHPHLRTSTVTMMKQRRKIESLLSIPKHLFILFKRVNNNLSSLALIAQTDESIKYIGISF